MRKILSKGKVYYYDDFEWYTEPWTVGPKSLNNNLNYINCYINKLTQKQKEIIKQNTFTILKQKGIKPGVYSNSINIIKVYNIDPIKRTCNVKYNSRFNRVKGINKWDLFFLVDYILDNNYIYKCKQ